MHFCTCSAVPGRWTGALEADSIAIVAIHARSLRVRAPDGQLEALRMLAEWAQCHGIHSRCVQPRLNDGLAIGGRHRGERFYEVRATLGPTRA